MRRSAQSDLLFLTLRASQVWAAHITLVLMVGALFLQIIARHFNWQIDWTEELSRFAFIAMVFLSASYASQMDSHLRVDAIADLIGRWGPARWVIDRLQFAAILLFDCLFFWYCIANLMEGFQYPNLSPAIGFNENLLFLAPIIGFGAAILNRLLSTVFEPPAPQAEVAEGLHP